MQIIFDQHPIGYFSSSLSTVQSKSWVSIFGQTRNKNMTKYSIVVKIVERLIRGLEFQQGREGLELAAVPYAQRNAAVGTGTTE